MGGAYFFGKERGGNNEKLGIDFFVPSHFTAGEKISYRVVYENKTSSSLRKIEATLTYPEGSMTSRADSNDLENVSSQTLTNEELEAGERAEFNFEAFLFGTLGEKKEVQLLVTYHTDDSNASLSIEGKKELEVASLPLALAFTFPSKVNLGEEFEFSLSYISTASSLFPRMGIEMEYPPSFQFLGSTPSSGRANPLWDIGNLEPGKSGEIKIRGVFVGDAEEKRIFNATLGTFSRDGLSPYVTQERQLGVSLPGFVLSQIIRGARGGAVTPGEKLTWEIFFQNVSGEILEGAEISVFFAGEAFEYSSLVAETGSFFSGDSLLRWDKNNLPALLLLEPGEEGTLSFSLPVKTILPVKDADDKNFSVTSKVIVKVGGATLAEDIHTYKVNSRFEFYQRGLRTPGPFENTGPIPPRVGEKSTYTLSWQLLNSSNDLSGVVVRGALPAHVRWEGVVSPEKENLTFNSNTGEVVWNIGNLGRGAGMFLPVRQVSFQVSLTPGTNTVGKTPELISGANAIAKDIFTGIQLESFAGPVDTTLPDDPSVSADDGVVR